MKLLMYVGKKTAVNALGVAMYSVLYKAIRALMINVRRKPMDGLTGAVAGGITGTLLLGSDPNASNQELVMYCARFVAESSIKALAQTGTVVYPTGSYQVATFFTLASLFYLWETYPKSMRKSFLGTMKYLYFDKE